MLYSRSDVHVYLQMGWAKSNFKCFGPFSDFWSLKNALFLQMCSLCELTVAQSGVRGAGGYRKDGVAEQCGNGAVLHLSIAPFYYTPPNPYQNILILNHLLIEISYTYCSRDMKISETRPKWSTIFVNLAFAWFFKLILTNSLS